MTKIILSPFKFLAVSYPGGFALAWAIPAILASFAIGLIFILDIDVQLKGEDGVLRATTSLFTVAGGFFVAALTVLITNDHPVLNGYFVGDHKPYIKYESEPLTRKRFLSLLFGYISFLSFFLVSFSILINIYFSLFERVSSFFLKISIFYIMSAIGAFAAFQVLLLSLVGLHYLTDRLHRSDGRSRFSITPPPAD